MEQNYKYSKVIEITDLRSQRNFKRLKEIAKVVAVSHFADIAHFEVNGRIGLMRLGTTQFYYNNIFGKGFENLASVIQGL